MQAANVRKARLAVALAAQAGTAGSSTGELAITNCRAYAVREPVSGREYAALKIETAAGISGWGETRSISATELERATAVLRDRQANELEPVRAGLAAMPNLQAAANMAQLDIVGQFTKAPVYQVLGGPTRHKVRALAPLAGADDTALVAAMKAAQAAGYRAFSVPMVPPAARNSGQAFVLANRKRFEALREAGGDDSDFVVDCAGALTPGDASSLSAALERLHPLWLDEPCGLTNLAAVSKVAAERVTPLGFGRTVTQSSTFQDLIRADSIDIFRPDLALNGISRIRRTSTLAETNYIAVAPYHDGGPIGTAAALHLAASLPNFFIQQIPRAEAEADQRFRSELVGSALENVTDGYIALSAAPGLGLKISASLLGKEVA